MEMGRERCEPVMELRLRSVAAGVVSTPDLAGGEGLQCTLVGVGVCWRRRLPCTAPLQLDVRSWTFPQSSPRGAATNTRQQGHGGAWKISSNSTARAAAQLMPQIQIRKPFAGGSLQHARMHTTASLRIADTAPPQLPLPASPSLPRTWASRRPRSPSMARATRVCTLSPSSS